MVSIPEANCSIFVPGSFKKYVDTFNTEIGNLIYHTYTQSDSLFNYQICYLDYPPGSVHSDSIELLKEFFTTTIESSLESVNGTKKYESETTQFEYPGYFWKIHYDLDKFMTTKAFVVGNRFYTLQVFGPLKNDKDNKQMKFFDSFRFLDNRKIR